MVGPIMVKIEPFNGYDMEGGNPEVVFNGFENYSMHILRKLNIENV